MLQTVVLPSPTLYTHAEAAVIVSFVEELSLLLKNCRGTRGNELYILSTPCPVTYLFRCDEF